MVLPRGDLLWGTIDLSSRSSSCQTWNSQAENSWTLTFLLTRYAHDWKIIKWRVINKFSSRCCFDEFKEVWKVVFLFLLIKAEPRFTAINERMQLDSCALLSLRSRFLLKCKAMHRAYCSWSVERDYSWWARKGFTSFGGGGAEKKRR